MSRHHPYVRIECWIGESTFPRCTADMLGGDQLTITLIDDPDETPVHVFQPGDWIRATVYDALGYPTASFTAKTPPKRLQPDERLTPLVSA